MTMNKYPDFSNYGYQITRELGHNRAGGRITYLALEINSQTPVVVKQFQFARIDASWSDYNAYEQEIEILRELDHPQIPDYLDSFPTVDGFCMVQEYKNALSLTQLKPWTPQEVKHIAISVLEILKYLQNCVPPVIHRDLKPDNILVSDRLDVSLVDFGFARLGGGEVAVSSVVKGTLGFMPPEQMFNRQLNQASDLYSLGVTLICLLTGVPATEVGLLIDEGGKINFENRVSDLSPAFISWLKQMVEPNCNNRYPNAQASLEELIPIPVLSPKKIVKNNYPIAFSSVCILLIAAVGFWAAKTSEHSTPKPPETTPPLINSVHLEADGNYLNLSPNKLTLSKRRSWARVNFVTDLSELIDLSELLNNQYTTHCQIWNGQGQLVAMGESVLSISPSQFLAFCFYNFRTGQDETIDGVWTFNLFVDGQLTATHNLTVAVD